MLVSFGQGQWLGRGHEIIAVNTRYGITVKPVAVAFGVNPFSH
jgi:hypothetical protein